MSPAATPIVDFAGALPTAERIACEIRSLFTQGGYSDLFGKRWAQVLEIPESVIEAVAELPETAARSELARLVEPFALTTEAIVKRLTETGVEATVIHNFLPTPGGMTNADLAAAIAPHQDRLIGFVRIDPDDLSSSLREADECVDHAGFRGITLTPFWHRIRADDARLDPLWEYCVARDLVAYVHTSVNWVRSVSLEYEHPFWLDHVAGRYPDLRIVAGHAGWPWVPDMVAVAMRQPNVFIDFSAFRPKHLATAGTGWEMLWYALSRTLVDKVVWGSTWTLLGRSIEAAVAEVQALDLQPPVLEKFTRTNARRLLGLDLAAMSPSPPREEVAK